jgi:Flp pilus assembly protein TadD
MSAKYLLYMKEARSRPSIGLAAAIVVCALMLASGGCSTVDLGEPIPSLTIQEPNGRGYSPSSEPYRLGAEQFSRGNYGLAESYFRDAAEKAPQNAAAWIGLAASYDRLRRFDLADRAYEKAIQITGETPLILNNQGYSQMLRGNLKSARAKFVKASERDPSNPIIINNLRLLERSPAYIQVRD